MSIIHSNKSTPFTGNFPSPPLPKRHRSAWLHPADYPCPLTNQSPLPLISPPIYLTGFPSSSLMPAHATHSDGPICTSHINKGFVVSHLNVRSIKNKIEEIHKILHFNPIDVLSISETWLTSQVETTLVEIDGFEISRADRTRGSSNKTIKKGGGLLIYTSSRCTVNSTKYLHLNTCNEDIETQILTVKKEQDRLTTIINVYRPPNGDPQNAQSRLDEILQAVSEERYADIFLLGDFNLDHTPNNCSDPTKNMLSMINSHGLTQLIDLPTRVSQTTSTIIDVVYTNSNKQTEPFVMPISLSDHYLVGCSRNLRYKKEATEHVYGRSYRNYSIERAREYYSSLDTSILFQFNDVDLAWKALFHMILNCANKLCPVKRITTRAHQPPWITKEIIELLADRDLLFQEALQNGKLHLLPRARELRTDAKRAMRNARSDFIKTKLANLKDDPRKFWLEVNSLINKSSSKATIELSDQDGETIDPSQSPDYINTFFATIGPKLAEQFHQTPGTHNNPTIQQPEQLTPP